MIVIYLSEKDMLAGCNATELKTRVGKFAQQPGDLARENKESPADCDMYPQDSSPSLVSLTG